VDLIGPLGKYRVTLAGGFSAPWSMSEKTSVRASIDGADGFVIAPFQIYSSDFMDRGFRNQYSTEAWPADDIVQLLAVTYQGTRIASTIQVSNNTGVVVPVAEIDAGDLFLILRLEPGARRDLHVLWGAEWHRCVTGTWRDMAGAIVYTKQMCFDYSSGSIPSRSFAVNIHTNRITVERK
jgi:hypothetical protein